MADQRGTMNEERIPRTNELPAHKNIYEKVYTDDRDVVLFWKTHMLYYVKTDRLCNGVEVEVDDRKFFSSVCTSITLSCTRAMREESSHAMQPWPVWLEGRCPCCKTRFPRPTVDST